MRLTFENIYLNGDDLFFNSNRLRYDLERLGYGKEHIDIIINALTEKADKKEVDPYDRIFNEI